MFKSIAEIKAAHEATGGHWFDSETMRFFKSRVYEGVTQFCGDSFFISSERNGDEPREYSIRYADDDGHVFTHGAYGEYSSLRQARAGLRKLIDDNPENYKWIVYMYQPAGFGFEVVPARSIDHAIGYLEAYTNDTGFYKDLTIVGDYGCTAALYPYSAEDWTEAMEYKSTGNPFGYPSKLIGFGPRGGAKVTNA